MNEIFDALNSKSLYGKHLNSSTLQNKNSNSDSSKLDKYVSYLSKLQFLTTNQIQIKCIVGFIQTIKGIWLITANLIESSNEWKYACTNRFNQDAIENLFSIIRYKKRKPSVRKFREILRRIMAVKLVYSSKFANCKGGINNMLIDWKAVLSNSESIIEVRIPMNINYMIT